MRPYIVGISKLTDVHSLDQFSVLLENDTAITEVV